MEGGAVTAMSLSTGYGRFAAAFNSLLVLLAFSLAPIHAQTTPIRIVVLGDSLAAGLGIKPEQSFPSRLEAALKAQGRNVAIANQGVSGDTTAGGLARVDWLLGDKPDIVLIELGANDALRGTDPAVTRAALSDILTRLKARNIAVMLCGMLSPPNYGRDYAERFNTIYPDLARSFGVPLYPFFLDGVAADAKLNQADGIHPTPQGVDIIVRNIMPTVEAFLGPLIGQHS
jgi:acyl-CoA thioesterase I